MGVVRRGGCQGLFTEVGEGLWDIHSFMWGRLGTGTYMPSGRWEI